MSAIRIFIAATQAREQHDGCVPVRDAAIVELAERLAHVEAVLAPCPALADGSIHVWRSVYYGGVSRCENCRLPRVLSTPGEEPSR